MNNHNIAISLKMTSAMILWYLIVFPILSCNESPSDEEATQTAMTTMTPTPTRTGTPDGTATPTPSASVTGTATVPPGEIEGHWVGDVYLNEEIGPCQPIEFWVTGTSVNGTITWTVGSGDADLNFSCDEDVNGVTFTWTTQSFSAQVVDNSFTWVNGNYVPDETVVGWFNTPDHAGGRWLHHSDEEHYNFGPWFAVRQNE